MYEDEIECGCEEEDRSDLRLVKDVPMLAHRVYRFHRGCGRVFWSSDSDRWHSLRHGLADYLHLLRTEKGYFRKTTNEQRRDK
jgi:hypothetical protein